MTNSQNQFNQLLAILIVLKNLKVPNFLIISLIFLLHIDKNYFRNLGILIYKPKISKAIKVLINI